MNQIAIVSKKEAFRTFVLNVLLDAGYFNVLCYKNVEGFNYSINPGCYFDVVIHDIGGVKFDEFIYSMGFKQIVVLDEIQGILKYANTSILSKTVYDDPDAFLDSVGLVIGKHYSTYAQTAKDVKVNSFFASSVLH